jgi:aryl-alcohol dehydrogenase-like predicted oxidoreductase
MTPEKVRLGRNELWGSPLASGTWALSRYWGGSDETAAVTAVHRALALGVNFFDSARLTASVPPMSSSPEP